jgi:hypothetical protein
VKDGRCSMNSVSSGSQHGDGLEELELTHRNDTTLATRRHFGLAAIVPLDASQQANRTSARVPLHVVCAWLGNSPRIAQQSYLPVTEDDFAKAAGVAKVLVEGGLKQASFARTNFDSKVKCCEYSSTLASNPRADRPRTHCWWRKPRKINGIYGSRNRVSNRRRAP